MSDELEVIKDGIEVTVPVTLPANLATLLIEHKGWELADGSEPPAQEEQAEPFVFARARFAPEPEDEPESKPAEDRSENADVPLDAEPEVLPNEPEHAAPAPAKKTAAKKAAAKTPTEVRTGPIKGNKQSMLYHMPGQPYYNRTKAEAYFETEEEAQAAGYKPWTPKPKKK